MKLRIIGSVLAAATILAIPIYAQAESAAAPESREFQFTNLRDITGEPGMGAPGGASIVRSANALDARLMAADLQPGHAYTGWFIVFNTPEACESMPCADTDLAGAGGAIHYGTGGVAGANGALNMDMTALVGGPPSGAPGDPNFPERGLTAGNGFAAEVHLIMVDHGIPATADFLSENPDVPGTWGWELTHPLPPGPTWVRGAIFLAVASDTMPAPETDEIQGFAWIDGNGNGVREAAESPDAGRSITLFRCGSPWGIAGSATTDTDGRFVVDGLEEGEYQLGTDVPTGGFAPLGNDNDVHANGFANCVAAGAPNSVGIGVLP